MRTSYLIFIFLFLTSCGKKVPKQSFSVEEISTNTPYDTAAIDSFSQGATSVDIARKIKMSSLKYQDSLKLIKLKVQEEQLLNKAKEDQLAAEKKAKLELDKAKEKAVNSKTESTVNP